jgi:hypothetical protein
LGHDGPRGDGHLWLAERRGSLAWLFFRRILFARYAEQLFALRERLSRRFTGWLVVTLGRQRT